MPSPLSVPGAKTTLILAMAMSLIGIVGVSGSLGALTSSPQDVAQLDPAAPPEVAAAWQALVEGFVRSSTRRALAVADLLASALLLIASFQLTTRARSALWWATQALWANVAYSFAAGAASVLVVQGIRPELMEFLAATMEAQNEPMPPDGAAGVPALLIACAAFFHALWAGAYWGLLRLSRREAVQRFVRREV